MGDSPPPAVATEIRRVEAGKKKSRPETALKVSPDQLKGPPKRIPVVYYLCRNRHLEHPHFIEVPLLSSSQDLSLKHFIERLNVARGKGMAALYSWSCKRSYKNGFVWHDLCEDDLIYPANGNEYVLKGSELLEDLPLLTSNTTTSDKQRQQQQQLILQPPKESHESSSTSSSSPSTGKLSRSTETSPDPLLTTELKHLKATTTSDSSSSPTTAELKYKLFKAKASVIAAADVATQTNDVARRTCTRGVSTEEEDEEIEEQRLELERIGSRRWMELELTREEVSPPPCSTSSGEKPETLESLITADRKLRNFHITGETEEDARVRVRSESGRPRVSDVLMQLISCGSISVKDHGFGMIPAYRTGFFPGDSNMMGDSGRSWWKSGVMRELDALSENPRFMGLKLEDKDYFSGSLIETKKIMQEEATLKRSSSYNADRTCDSLPAVKEEEHVRSKCLPRTIKATQRHLRSPLSEHPRKSSAGTASSPLCSKQMRDTPPTEASSSRRFESVRQENQEKIIKIEERLPSGAWVVIQSKAANEERECQ